jgi:hypothetical protein
MSRPRSAGAFFWGLILISIGLIFLMRNLGFEIPIWKGIATYWPILLILWGSIKLVDYVRWKRAGQPGPLFGAGEVVLLIIVILSGTLLTAAANLSPELGRIFEIANIDLWDITGNSYSYTENYEREAAGGHGQDRGERGKDGRRFEPGGSRSARTGSDVFHCGRGRPVSCDLEPQSG